jgi:AcrR family transcriptional regulator
MCKGKFALKSWLRFQKEKCKRESVFIASAYLASLMMSIMEPDSAMKKTGKSHTASTTPATPMKRPLSLREELKRSTRAKLDQVAIELIARQGYRDTTVQQIAEAAGTTRTTFYQYFNGKPDLINMLQATKIGPAMIDICGKLDAIDVLTRASLREWVTQYAGTWKKLHLFFDAYSDASRMDPTVAATMAPNSYAVTSSMTRLPSLLEGEARQHFHDKLIILLSALERTMFLVVSQREKPATSLLLDRVTDIFWDSLIGEVSLLLAEKRK